MYSKSNFACKFWCPPAIKNWGNQFTCCILPFFCLSAYLTCVRLDFARDLDYVSASAAENMGKRNILDCRMFLQSGKIYVGPVGGLKEVKGQNCWL